MLHEFLSNNHDDLVQRCRVKAARRLQPAATARELEFGIPLFLAQLIDTLRAEESVQLKTDDKISLDIGSSAGKHGHELLLTGFTIDQVVHDYGDLCQAVTELAHEQNAPITVEEFHTFNRCLDNAMAYAVTEFGRQRDEFIAKAGNETMNERLGCLAHELRNLLNSAMLSFQVIRSGSVALTGATGAVLGRSLIGLRDLVDRSLADVRLTDGLEVRRESIPVREFIQEAQIAAILEANERGIKFEVAPVEDGLVVDADRQMLSSAIGNVLQNAFKFTTPSGHVSLTARKVAGRVIIDIADECGGLSQGSTEELFQPFNKRGSDRTGLGLGLSISRRGVEASGGQLRVLNVPGTGCIFTIDLPQGRVANR